jgi:conjugal transfer ATP-binding protein TraC
MQRDMINSFGSAKDQWFSSFMLQVEAHTPGIVCSSIPSAAQCTPQAGRFEYIKGRKKQGTDIHDAVYELASRNFPAEMAELEARIACDNIRNAA